jgi:hypothetical protein
MAVSASILIQAVAQARVALVETLSLKIGAMLDAVVVGGKGANGLTALRIGEALIEAKLPQDLPAGTTLQLVVKAGRPLPQFAIVAVKKPEVPQQPMMARAPIVTIGQSLAASGSRIDSPPTARPALPEARMAAQQAEQPASASVIGTHVRAAIGPVPQASRVNGGPAARGAPQGQPSTAPNGGEAAGRPVPTAPGPSTGDKVEPRTTLQTPSAGRTIATADAPPRQTLISQDITVGAGRALPAGAAPAREAPASSSALPSGIVGGNTSAVPPHADAGASKPMPPGVVPAVKAASPNNAQDVTRTVHSTPAPTAKAGVVTIAASGASGDAAEPNPLQVARAAPRLQASASLPKAMTLPSSASAFAMPVAPSAATPAAVLAQMVPEALARQNSLGPLLVHLAEAAARAVLPEPVLRAAVPVFAQRVAVEANRLAPAVLERAVARSGLFLEATLAQTAEAPAGDLKAALLSLRAVLGRALGTAPQLLAPVDRVSPPLRGVVLRADVQTDTPLPSSPREVLRVLHGDTDAAIARIKVAQSTALPEAMAVKPAPAELRLELPLMIGAELVMAQLQIAPDGRRSSDAKKRGWTVRFALSMAATGEIGAEVGVFGKTVNVALWAAESETAEALAGGLGELSSNLSALGLEVGAVRVRRGLPAAAPASAGQMLDAVS